MDCKASWDNLQVGFSLLQAEQFLGLSRQEILRYLNHLCGLSMDSLWYIHVFLVLGNLKLYTGCQCQVQWKDHLSQLTDTPVSNGAHWPPLPQGHFVGSCSAWCLPGPFLPAAWPPLYIGGLSCSSPSAGFSPCWTAWNSCQPISPSNKGKIYEMVILPYCPKSFKTTLRDVASPLVHGHSSPRRPDENTTST